VKQKTFFGGRKKKKSVLIQFTVSYLFLLVIPVMSGVANYWSILSALTDREIYADQLILNHSKENLENSLTAIDNFTYSTKSSTRLSQVMNSGEDRNLVDVQKVIQDLPDFHDMNNYVKSYYLFSYRNHLIFTHHQAYLNVKPYQSMFEEYGISYEELENRIFFSETFGSELISLSTEKGSCLIYRLPYYDMEGRLTGQFIFFLDTDQVQKLLLPAFRQGAAFLYLTNGNGEPIIELSREGFSAVPVENTASETDGIINTKIAGKSMVVPYCRSEKYDLTFVIAIPSESLRQESLRAMVPLLVGIALLAGMGVALVIVSYIYNRRPLATIVDQIDFSADASPLQAQNGLWRLSQVLTGMLQKSSTMRRQLEAQNAELRSAFLMQLVTGGPQKAQTIAQDLAEYDIITDPFCRRFRGIYLKFLTKEPCQISESSFAAYCGQKATRLTICCRVNDSNYALLYSEASGEPDGCEAYLLRIHSEIQAMSGLETVFYIGPELDAPSDISDSFREARRLFYSQGDDSDRILIQADSLLSGESFEYSAAQEEKMQDLIASGDFSDICTELDMIRENNFSRKKLSPYMKELLFSRMLGTLACSRWNRYKPLSVIDPAEIAENDFFNLLKQQYRTLCETASAENLERQTDLEDSILAFIRKNYSDSQLSLTMLSMEFGMTECYLSALIKRKAGEKFSTYLERLRISRANELLAENKLSISEIGAAVGYDSATSFGRAYKRSMGFSPGKYLQRKENPEEKQ
jgi:two-component system response regulator YesN